VRNRVSLANTLPYRQRAVIERIPGVAAITPFTFFGGKFRNEDIPSFAQFAMDPVQLTNVFGEAKLPLDQLNNWIADRSSCIIGIETAKRYDFKIGDKIKLVGTVWPADLELTIKGIYKGTPDDRNVLFHHDYMDEACGRLGIVGTWWVRAKSLEEVPLVVERINKEFKNTSAEVLAETERSFVLGFISMWGNIKILIGSISTVVVFTLILVSGSTMSMAIRERFRELAVLKALGFRRHELFAFILAESFGFAMLGALVGVGGAWLLYTNINITAATKGMFVAFELTPRIMAIGFGVASLLGVVASIMPSISMARMSVVQGLKTLD